MRRSRSQSAGSDRKSTRLHSSHRCISYAVFCLKKKKPAATAADGLPPSTSTSREVGERTPRIVSIALDLPAPLRPSRAFFFFNDTATTEIYTLSLHDALPI